MSKPIIIFLEGTDGVGKSTLRRMLGETIDWLIIERSPLSILVYGKFFRRKYNFGNVKLIEETIAKNFIVVPIFLKADYEALAQRFKREDGKRIGTPEEVFAIQNMFLIAIENSKWDWHVFDTSKGIMENTVKFIKRMIEEAELEAVAS